MLERDFSTFLLLLGIKKTNCTRLTAFVVMHHIVKDYSQRPYEYELQFETERHDTVAKCSPLGNIEVFCISSGAIFIWIVP